MRFAAAAAESDVGKNVSQTDLARRMSVSSQSVSRYISGQQDVSLWRLHAIADALGVRVRDLFKE